MKDLSKKGDRIVTDCYEFVVVDVWHPMPGYTAKTVLRTDLRDPQDISRTTYLREGDDGQWFRAP